MSSQKVETEDVRTRIIEAALDLFSAKGFHATTTVKIAQKAGVNEVTVFRHFKNKVTLFHEVLNEIKKIGFDAKRIEGLDFDPEDTIRFCVEAIFEIFETFPREIRLLNLALFDGVDGFEETFVQKNMSMAIEFISDAFRKLQDQNRIISKEDPEMLAHMLLCQCLEMATSRIVKKLTPLRKYDRASLSQSVTRLFLV